MAINDIVVAGAGVAGATFAYEAARKGFKVRVYDVAERYAKACGDALTVRDETLEIARLTSSILGRVKRYLIAVDGEIIEEFSLPAAAWVIVDKARMVNTLRELATVEGAEIVHGHWRGERGRLYTVDARGPYARSYRESVLLYRAIAKAEWDPETALLDFAVNERGVYWIFPADDNGARVNVGAGFDGIKSAAIVKKRVWDYLVKWTGKGLEEAIDERGAPLQIYAPVEPYSSGVFKIGEAGGLMLRTGGEGNRPAILSAKALAAAFSEAAEPGEARRIYLERIHRLLDEVETSLVIVKLVASARPETAAKLLRSLPPWFWRDFVRARIYKPTVLRIAASSPEVGLGLLRAALDRLRNLPY